MGHIGTEVTADALSKEWKGNRCDQWWGWQMGSLHEAGRPDLHQCRSAVEQGAFLLQTEDNCYKRAYVCLGCILDANLSVLSLVIIKKNEKVIPGLPDTTVLQ